MRKKYLPKVQELDRELREIERLQRHFTEIHDGYERWMDVACDPRSGHSEVKVTSSGSNYVFEAVTSNPQVSRDLATVQRIYDQVKQARQILENVLGLCQITGIQQMKVAKDATMTQEQLDLLLLRKRMAG